MKGTDGSATAALSAGIVLLATVANLSLGLLTKEPCALGRSREANQLCYSDLRNLYDKEGMDTGRLPYLDPCPGEGRCDEYPVLTMYTMRAAGWATRSKLGFLYANAALLAAIALAVSWALYRRVGSRALYWALAPTLAVYAFINWDLVAVGLATAATMLFLRDRDWSAGVLLGLGAAAKLYPALLLVPFAMERLRNRRRHDAVRLVAGAVVAFAVVNVPFAIAGYDRWSTFFRFNAGRAADFDSLWHVACNRLEGDLACPWSPRLINLASWGLLVIGAGLIWRTRSRREPDFPRWLFGFPLLIVFLLTSKVYSPQYGLWLLPWFALALPNTPHFVAFGLADVAVFVTRFSWQGRLAAELGVPGAEGLDGLPIGAFQIALLVRAAVLVWMLAAWAGLGSRTRSYSL
jgi:hypothetical protein